MSKVIFLYRKTHNITGLKYLGITSKDPYKYVGSGKYWVSHVKQHGNDVTTEILKECTIDNVEYWGLHYSDLLNVVESDEYANLKPESGYGGTGMLGKKHSSATKAKISETNMGHNVSDEARKKMSDSHKGKTPINKGKTGLFSHSDSHKNYLSEKYAGEGNPFYGKEHTEEFKKLQREKQTTKVTCPHCGKMGAMRIMKRWHFNNCKEQNVK